MIGRKQGLCAPQCTKPELAGTGKEGLVLQTRPRSSSTAEAGVDPTSHDEQGGWGWELRRLRMNLKTPATQEPDLLLTTTASKLINNWLIILSLQFIIIINKIHNNDSKKIGRLLLKVSEVNMMSKRTTKKPGKRKPSSWAKIKVTNIVSRWS